MAISCMKVEQFLRDRALNGNLILKKSCSVYCANLVSVVYSTCNGGSWSCLTLDCDQECWSYGNSHYKVHYIY